MDNRTVANYELHRFVIFTGVILFTGVGLCGNFSLIMVHIRVPKLRSKYGLLLSLLSLCQSLCLIFEWVGGIYILFAPDIADEQNDVLRPFHLFQLLTCTVTGSFLGILFILPQLLQARRIRSACLKFVFGYVFLHCVQTGLMATIAVDLLISIVFPLWHRITGNVVYVTLISLPSVLYGLVITIFGLVDVNDDRIYMCNPPSSLHGKVKLCWYVVAFIAGGITILSYIVSYFILRYYSKRHVDQPQDFARRTMRSMSIIVLIFLCTRYLATVGANILNMASVDPITVELFQNYCVFAAMICYSQNFYVTFWRSSEYREALWKQHAKFHNKICGMCCLLRTHKRVFSEHTPEHHRHGAEHFSMTHI